MDSRRSGCVLYLYESSDAPSQQKLVSGTSEYELVEMAQSILRRLNRNNESGMRLAGNFGQIQVPVNVFRGNGYTIKVKNLKGAGRELLNFRDQNAEPLLRKLDESAFRSVRDTKIYPMFLVELRENETVPRGLELQLTIHKKSNFTLKCVILKQNIFTMEWSDITNICTSGRGTLYYNNFIGY